MSIFPNSGISWENKGGVIIFRGKCNIGNNSYISVGESGRVVFGDNFCATTTFRLISYNRVEFGNTVLFGWDCICLDTDFHRLTRLDGENSNIYNSNFGTIMIEDKCWISMKCILLKNTYLGHSCVVAANSMLNTSYTENYCMYAGAPAKIVKKGIYRNPESDIIEY